MNEKPFLTAIHGVQAFRRRCEQIRDPLGGAMGIAAEYYPHQIGNVSRVLEDTQVRHLIADEVGLGKTVQALMIMNALRLQRSDLRALIVVPNDLLPQWRDELMTRGHKAPAEEEPDEVEGRFTRLAWQEKIKNNLSEIDPDVYDLLIVDELHTLRTDLQERIVEQAPNFQHLLVLTATPHFQEITRRCQILQLLEPARIELARQQALFLDKSAELKDLPLSRWPEGPMAAVLESVDLRERNISRLLDDSTPPTEWPSPGAPPDGDASLAARAHCSYRRVIRTRRADYTGLLPQRVHHSKTVEPLGVEEERQHVMWRYFEHLDDLSRGV